MILPIYEKWGLLLESGKQFKFSYVIPQTNYFFMNNLLKFGLGIAASVIAFRVITVKPVRNYLLNALLDGAVFMIKRKLR